MTDRYFALTVILENVKREDDAQPLIEAIKMMKGVIDVKPHIATPDTYWAHENACMDLRKALWDVLQNKKEEEQKL